ncbi:hypothetical protein [Bacillus toyonensis]|uniref:hypothetical protein n=1 Tax=Bacillus toyonensis TaxID=155322 RepID=UPI0011557A8B|nr:hypothetical protein [Bacillus toyonensis]
MKNVLPMHFNVATLVVVKLLLFECFVLKCCLEQRYNRRRSEEDRKKIGRRSEEDQKKIGTRSELNQTRRIVITI